MEDVIQASIATAGDQAVQAILVLHRISGMLKILK